MIRPLAYVLMCLGAHTPASKQQPPARYSFPADATIVFRVEIRADKGDFVEVHSGRPQLKVFGPASTGGTRLGLAFAGLVGRTELTPEKSLGQADPLTGTRPFPIVAPMAPATFGFHELTVDERGRVIREKGAIPLPYALGTVASLILEPLPEQPADGWKRTERTILAVGRETGALGIRMLPLPSSPYTRPSDDGETLAGEETSLFKPENAGKDQIRYKREYRLATVAKSGGEPRFELELTGTHSADAATALPADIELKGKMTSRKDNLTVRVPITVSIHRMAEAEMVKIREDQAKAASEAKARMEEEARRRKEPISKSERTAILEGLSNPESRKVREALRMLDKREPEKPDAAIAAKLATILGANDRFLAMQAAKALVHHATEAETGALLKALETNDVLVAQYCMKALAKTKAKKAPAVLVSKIANISMRHPASEALKAMGPMAEEPVSGLLKSEDWNLRMAGCEILAVIGTEKSAKVLKKLADSDENSLVKHKAGEALDAMARRK